MGLVHPFWICWTAMLVASIVIIIQAPKCPSPAPKNWWQKRPFYQISVKSFKDSNSDGNGDLNGVLEKADYLANTVGVGSIGLSPIMKEGDYQNVDESLGTLEDFKKLVAGLHDTVLVDPKPMIWNKLWHFWKKCELC